MTGSNRRNSFPGLLTRALKDNRRASEASDSAALLADSLAHQLQRTPTHSGKMPTIPPSCSYRRCAVFRSNSFSLCTAGFRCDGKLIPALNGEDIVAVKPIAPEVTS